MKYLKTYNQLYENKLYKLFDEVIIEYRGNQIPAKITKDLGNKGYIVSFYTEQGMMDLKITDSDIINPLHLTSDPVSPINTDRGPNEFIKGDMKKISNDIVHKWAIH